MQEENEDFLQFLARVDAYQYSRRLRRVEACREIGISERTLSAIRNGKSPTVRAWAKLEAAERKAGIAVRPAAHPLSEDSPLEGQPSDAHLRATRAELSSAFPTQYRLALKRELAVLADHLGGGDYARTTAEQDRLDKLLSATIEEAFRNAAARAIHGDSPGTGFSVHDAEAAEPHPKRYERAPPKKKPKKPISHE